MESVLKTYLQKKPVNSGFLYGPFCPIYGFGAIFMFLFLQGFKDNIALLFTIAFFVLSFWEYIVGWLLEKIFNTKYWDYSENKFNIKGRVCLMNSLFWGFLGVIFIKYMHPFISEKIDMIPQNMLTFNVIMITIAIIVDTVISSVKVTNIQAKLEKLKEITNTIKEKLEELEKKQVNKENLQAVIEELKSVAEKSVISAQLVNELFSEKYDLASDLGELIYCTKIGEELVAKQIYKRVKQFIDDLRNGKGYPELESCVNRYCENVMAVLRNEIPDLKETNYRQLCYHYAGFSVKIICIFMDETASNIYKRRSRLRDKIANANTSHKDILIRF